MKHRLRAILLIFALLLTTGCSVAGAREKLDVAEDRVEEKLDAAEDSVENAVRKTAKPAPTTALTAEDADKIALEYVGLTLDQITALRTEYEIEDGIPQYDVSFYEGDWKYEFKIHAKTGKILSFDKDQKSD